MSNIAKVLNLLEDEENELLERLEQIKVAKLALTKQLNNDSVKYHKFIKETGRFTKNRLRDILSKNVIKIEYIKADGSLRIFEKATLDTSKFSYEFSNSKKIIDNQNKITIYDLVDKQWKSLIISEIIAISYKG